MSKSVEAPVTGVIGLTHPYVGKQPCTRIYLHGHTFRWAKGDRYVAVMNGHCIEQRRCIIVRDTVPRPVLEGPQPLIDVIPTPDDDWADTEQLYKLATRWTAKRGLRPTPTIRNTRP